MGCGTKAVVWGLWAINLLVSAVYMGVSMTTFVNISKDIKYLGSFENRDAYKSSLLAACILGFLMVLFWCLFSFFVLIGHMFSDVRLGYGMMLGTCIHTGFFMLLSGLVLNTHENLAQAFKDTKHWTDADYNTYVATYGFSYILTGTYLIMFLLLLLFQGHMGRTAKESVPTASSFHSIGSAKPGSTSATVATPAAPAVVEMPYNNHGFGTNWGGTYGQNV